MWKRFEEEKEGGLEDLEKRQIKEIRTSVDETNAKTSE